MACQPAAGAGAGKYFGIKDAFTNISCAVLSYIGGMILDAYTKTGDQRMGFWGVGVLVLVLALINISCFLPVREPIIEEEKKKINLKVFLQSLLKTHNSGLCS